VALDVDNGSGAPSAALQLQFVWTRCEEDGNNLFRAVSLFLYDTQGHHREVRMAAFTYMKAHEARFYGMCCEEGVHVGELVAEADGCVCVACAELWRRGTRGWGWVGGWGISGHEKCCC
jgi:hypothetical protein